MLTPRFWLSTLVSVVIIMILIVIIKKVSSKYNVPFLSTLSKEV